MCNLGVHAAERHHDDLREPVQDLAVQTGLRRSKSIEKSVRQRSAYDVGVGAHVRHPRSTVDVTKLAEGHAGRDSAQTTTARSRACREHAEASASNEKELRRRIARANDGRARCGGECAELWGKSCQLVGIEARQQL